MTHEVSPLVLEFFISVCPLVPPAGTPKPEVPEVPDPLVPELPEVPRVPLVPEYPLETITIPAVFSSKSTLTVFPSIIVISDGIICLFALSYT